MNAYELTDYIIKENKVIEVLEALNCCGIRTHAKEYRCGLPNDYNKNRVSVNKNNLHIRIFTHETTVRGNFYTLVMYIYNCSFPQSVKKLHNILGLKYIFNKKDIKKQNKKDILKVFKKATQKYKLNYEQEHLEVYNNDIYKGIIQIPYIGWIREGIMPFTQEEFKIGYSIDKNRICIPHRYWSGCNNEFVGIMGRTLIKNYDILDIPKYFPLVKFPKSMNLYGLQENYSYIQKAGYVNVFESEKSTLKRHSRMDKTGVSLGCHEISEEQAKILISLDVDIIIQMDKDIEINHVRSLCEKFYGIRNVYYVFDEFGLLKEKESPADKINNIYLTLWNRKIKYNEKEHKKYLKWINQKSENNKY